MSRGHVLRVLAVGFAAGLMAGFFGVGGGIVLVPLILFVLRTDQHTAHATSLVAIVLISLSGAIGYGMAGEVDVATGLALGVGGVVGAALGARVMHRLSVPALRMVFAVVLVVAGLRMVI